MGQTDAQHTTADHWADLRRQVTAEVRQWERAAEDAPPRKAPRAA